VIDLQVLLLGSQSFYLSGPNTGVQIWTERACRSLPDAQA
jgi:hypothetical protein